MMNLRSLALLVLLPAAPAFAQQWSALDRVPRPYNIIAVDSSMTMAIEGGSWASGSMTNRMGRAKTLLTGWPGSTQNGAMYLFRDQFAFGTYSYSGAYFAHIKDGATPVPRIGTAANSIAAPIWNDRAASFSQTVARINGLNADFCLHTGKNSYNCLEQYLPGGVAGQSCILPEPNPGCANDRPVLEALVANPIPGLRIPPIPRPPGYPANYEAGWPEFAFACDNRDPTNYPDPVPTDNPLPAGCPRVNPGDPARLACLPSSLNIAYELAHELRSYQWPRTLGITEIRDQICTPLETAIPKLEAKLASCLTSPPALSPPLSCVPPAIMSSICSASSPFRGGTFTLPDGSSVNLPVSCICDPAQAGCSSGGGSDACGQPLFFPARQQVGICHSHDGSRQPAATLADITGAPGDKRLADVNDPDRYCRSNSVTFVTDAEGSHPVGVASQRIANRQVYSADLGVPQNNVLGIDNSGDGLQGLIRGTPTPALNPSVGDIQNRFARELNRALKGVYAAAAPALSQYQDRAAFMVMEVPGTLDANHLDYFGRPVRLEWWSMNPTTGVPISLLFSTDEASRAGVGLTLSGATPTYLGPPGAWRSGTPITMTVGANALDRNGDGTADSHPPVRWGMHLGGEGSRPVIVGAPTDVPEGRDRTAAAVWQRSLFARHRVAYALSNGYLHAYRVGIPTVAAPGATNGSVGAIQVGISYDDNPATPGMGSEIFRYQPSFITAAGNPSSATIGGAPRYTYNNLLQQPLLERGQLFVRDVQLSKSPVRFATVLIVSQGPGGRGYAALDVSTPNAPVVLWDGLLMLPGARAIAPPTIYMWPDPAGGDAIPALVVAGGALTPSGGTFDRLHAYRVSDGTEIANIALPRAGGVARAWPNTPVCVDRDGGGRVDRCFVLASDGTVALTRINPSNGGFLGVDDVTPASVRGGGRVFTSGLAAYFTSDNNVALVFGSGDASRIERGDGTANFMYKIVSRGSGGGAPTPAALAGVCRPGAAVQDGTFPLPAGHMVISPPTVAKGTVAFSTYRPGNTGCADGSSALFAFDFETCRDAINPASLAKPTVGAPAGAGMPSQPVILRRSGKILVHTTEQPSGGGATSQTVTTRGGALETVRPLFFRVRSSSR